MKEEKAQDAYGRVVPLRRPAPGGGSGRPRVEPAVEDLSRYERRDDDDDYRHRMITNVAAIAFMVLLVMGGIWVANKAAEVRKNQDCVFSGRRVCSPLEITSTGR
jgi:hypothetical protein